MHKFNESGSNTDTNQTAPAAAERGRWSPYQDNGGTVMAVAGENFCVLGGDTRMSSGYSIVSRNVIKHTKLTEKVYLISGGMKADVEYLRKRLQASITMYKFEHDRTPSIEALAQHLSTLLYSRRFFPLYTLNLLGGVNAQGKGVLYEFDAIGGFGPETHGSAGSGGFMVRPVLDSLYKNRVSPPSEEEAVALVKAALTAVAERDTCTGDGAQIVVVSADKSQAQIIEHSLKQD